jgi:hypothetical protein
MGAAVEQGAQPALLAFGAVALTRYFAESLQLVTGKVVFADVA